MEQLQPDIYATRHLSPMLLSISAPFDNPEFIYELKYDGARALFYIGQSDFHIVSRKGNDLTEQFPEFLDAWKWTAKPCVLDGEIFGENFNAYLKRGNLHSAVKIRLAANATPLQFAVFDILYRENRDLTALPLFERKKILAETVFYNKQLLQVESIPEHGTAFYKLAKQAGMEGIVAKRKTSPYIIGRRTENWLKMK